MAEKDESESQNRENDMKIEQKNEPTGDHYNTEEIEVYFENEEYVIQVVSPLYTAYDTVSRKTKVIRFRLNEDDMKDFIKKLEVVRSESEEGELNFN